MEYLDLPINKLVSCQGHQVHLLQAVVQEHLSRLLMVGLFRHPVVKGVNPIVQR